MAWDEVQELLGEGVFGDETFVHHGAVLETGNKAALIVIGFEVISCLNLPEPDSPGWTGTRRTCPGLRPRVSTRPAAQPQNPGGRVGARGGGSSPHWELKGSGSDPGPGPGSDPGPGPGKRPGALTCLAPDEAGSLIRPAERRHHDLIMASRGEGGEPMLPRVARQRHGREDPGVVEEQSHLMSNRNPIRTPQNPIRTPQNRSF